MGQARAEADAARARAAAEVAATETFKAAQSRGRERVARRTRQWTYLPTLTLSTFF